MSFASNVSNLATRISTEVKALRTLINGNASDLSALNTTAKTNLVAAINEANTAALSGNIAPATETFQGKIEIATQTEVNTGTDDERAVTPLKFQTRLAAYAQPLDSDLTAIAALTTSVFGRSLLALADGTALANAVSNASETASGTIEIATQAETNTGTDDVRAITPLKFQTRMAAYAQPLDSDLTSIAALTTTSYGRAFLTLADQTALMALVASGSTSVAGKLLLASTAEVTTGTDNAKAATAAGVKAHVDSRIDNNNSLGSSTTNAPSQGAVKAYVDALLGANDAMVFKGAINASANPNYPAADAGDTYRISVAGKIGGAAGPNVEIGDILIAIADGSAAGTHASVGANWTIIQTNIDGAVTGPAASVSGNIATFNGTSGKVVQDSGLSASTATALGTSNTLLPTQNAVKVYADTKQPLDATLTALAGLTTAANQMIYSTGVDTFAMTALTAFGRSLIDDADAAAGRTTLDVYSKTEIGNPETNFVAVFEAGLV